MVLTDCERERQNTKNHWGLALFSRGMLNNVANVHTFAEKVNY